MFPQTNKTRLKVVAPLKYGNPTGVITYFEDFKNIVWPEVMKHFQPVPENELADAVFSFSAFQKPMIHQVHYAKAPIYQILHNDLINMFTKWSTEFVNHRFVTHYTHLYGWMVNRGLKAYYIPMAVDTKKLPYRNVDNGKMIYFSNLYVEKQKTVDKLKEMGLEFDIMSSGQFNGQGGFNWSDAIEIVSNYEYGIGVGRSAIEMLAMGMKVIVAGKKIGGVISNSNEMTKHWASNCNTLGYSNYSEDTFLDDIKNLQFRVDKDERKIFDMRNYLNLYRTFFKIKE